MPGRGRLSRARAIAGAGCGRPSRARPSIAGLGAGREFQRSLERVLHCRARGRGLQLCGHTMLALQGAGCTRGAALRSRIDVISRVLGMEELLCKIMWWFGSIYGLAQLYRVFLALSQYQRSLLKGKSPNNIRERWVHGEQPAYTASQWCKYYKMKRRHALSIVEECFLVSRLQRWFFSTRVAQSLLTQAMQETLSFEEDVSPGM